MKKTILLSSWLFVSLFSFAQSTQKPPLHGKNWMAITGKPLAATAGSIIFERGGNAPPTSRLPIGIGCRQ